MRSSKNGQTKPLCEVWEAFQEQKLGHLAIKTQQNYTGAAKLIPAGKKPARDYEPQDIARLLKDLRPGAYMVARGFFSSLFSFAIRQGWATVNPVRGVETRKLGHVARWSREEALSGIKAVEDEEVSLALDTMYASGQRLSDVLLAAPYNLNNGRLVLKQKKTGNVVDIPLPENITKRLLALDRQPCEPFFRVNNKKVWRVWRGVRKELGMNNRKPHGLRKAASCEAAEGGASEAELQAFLGHKTSKAAALYRMEANKGILAGAAVSKRAQQHAGSPQAQGQQNEGAES